MRKSTNPIAPCEIGRVAKRAGQQPRRGGVEINKPPTEDGRKSQSKGASRVDCVDSRLPPTKNLRLLPLAEKMQETLGEFPRIHLRQLRAPSAFADGLGEAG